MTHAERWQRIVAFAAIYLFWSATFLAIRYAVTEVPPLLTIAIRCGGGALILYGWLGARGELERTTAAQWKIAAVAGVMLFLGCHAVLAWAEQRVSSGQAALLLTSTSLGLVLLTAARERKVPSPRILLGLAAGIAGIALLARGPGMSGSAGTPWDRIALAACGLSWAAGSLIARHGARPRSAAQSTAMQLATGAVAVLLASLAAGELGGWTPAHLSLRAVGSLVFLIVCGTVLGLWAYTWLLRVTTPAAVGTFAFVNPMVALGLAWLVGDEAPSRHALIAAVLVLGAVVLTQNPSAGEKT
jgi:drug/metabolite transporter (DMT)-like permease